MYLRLLLILRISLIFLLASSVQSSFPHLRSIPQSEQYAQTIASSLGSGYADIYWNLVRNRGWEPLNAYHGVWAYNNGWHRGYLHGWLDGVYHIYYNAKYGQEWTRSWIDLFQREYKQWEEQHKSWAWSSNVWGMYQQGYIDGKDRGAIDGWNKAVQIRIEDVPVPGLSDFMRYQRSLGIDPDDPFGDLPVVEQITGPMGGR